MALPKTIANFETSLANGITASDMALTLVTSVTPDNTALSGSFILTLDEGTNVEEHMLVTLSGSAGTIVTRGLSRENGTSTVSGKAFAHNRGASVKITNFVLLNIDRELRGEQFENALQGTNAHNFKLGDGTAVDNKLSANNADANKPFIIYSETDNAWLISNDGVNTYNPQAGGSGVTAGQGISITAGVVSTKLNASTKLVKNLGSNNDELAIETDVNNALDGRSGSPSSSQPYETSHDTSNAATITASTISFTASTKTIADSGSGFVTANFIAGTQITVTGSGSNNGTFTIVSVAAGAIVVAETLVDESAGASVTLTTVTANKLVRYSSTSQVKVPLTPVATNDAVSKNYSDSANRVTIPLGESFTGATTPQPAYIVNDLCNPIVQAFVPTGRVTLDNSGQQKQAVSFTPRANATSQEVILLMAKVSTPGDNIFVTIETDNAGSPSGTPITNGTSANVAGSSLANTIGTYQSFTFGSAFTLTANTKYWIVLQRDSSLSDGNYYFVGSSSNASSDYASFVGKYYDGSSWQSSRLMWFNIVPSSGGSMSLWQSDANATPANNGFVKSFHGFCITTGSAGDNGTLIASGKVGGFSGLLSYSDYFVSTTKGALSITNNGQFVGNAASATEIMLPSTKNGVQTGYGIAAASLGVSSIYSTPFFAPYNGFFTITNITNGTAVNDGLIVVSDASDMSTNTVSYYLDEITNGQRTSVTVPVRKGQFISISMSSGSVQIYFIPTF